MKKCIAFVVVLLAASLPSFGSHAQPSPSNQFRAKHSKIPVFGRIQSSLHDGPPASLTHAQKTKFGANHARPKRYGQGGNTATTSVGLVSAPLISMGGEDDDETFPALGDFNGDGKQDVVKIVSNQVNSNLTYQLSVLLSNGNGTFQSAVLTTLTSNTADPILVGDLNGDGKDDVLQVHPNATPSTVDVYLSNGDGTFAASTNVQLSGFTLNGGVLTDVNGDGKLDIMLVDSENPGIVSYLLGNGDGTFQAAVPMATLAAAAPDNIVFADFNGDGKIDFAGQVGIGQLVVYLATGGVFASPVSLATSDSAYTACANFTGDLTNDGKPEIVSINCEFNTLTVYVNNGDGTFQTGVYYQNPGDSSVDPYSAAIADFNGDGKNDIVVGGDESGEMTVFLGNGDGTISPLSYGFGIGGYVWETPLVADFNGDGILDIMQSNDNFTFSYLEGNGDGTFRSALSYYAATSAAEVYTYDIATGDFNGDGIPDVVVGQDGESGNRAGILVMLSNPDGSLQPGVSYGTSKTLTYIAVGDFNGDQKLDIAATDYYNGGVQIFLGNGDGTFTVGQSFATDTSGDARPENLVVGDFNHDGKLDLAIANNSSATVGVLLGNGDGTFSAPTSYPIENGVYGIAAADLNGDGYLDLATTTYSDSGNNVSVLLANNDNSGTFQAATDVATGSGNAEYIAIGDLNGDGKADMAITMESNSTYPGGAIVVALGNGDGTFQAATAYNSSTLGGTDNFPYPTGIVMTDFDGDGKLDLVYNNYSYGTVAIMYGKGDGTFYTPIDFAISSGDWQLAVADVNGDGAPDVVVPNYYAGGATVALNNSGSKTSANFILTATQTSQTVTAGSAATYGITMTGTNGYNGTVTFSCSGLPAGANCSFSPASVAANGNASIATTMTITTTSPTTSSLTTPLLPNSKPGAPMFLASLTSLGLFGIVLASNKQRRMRVLPVAALFVLMSLLVGCSGVSSHGSTSSGTPAGSYTVAVHGAGSNNVSHSTNVQFIVQ